MRAVLLFLALALAATQANGAKQLKESGRTAPDPTQQKGLELLLTGDSPSLLVDRSIQVIPFASNGNVRLVGGARKFRRVERIGSSASHIPARTE